MLSTVVPHKTINRWTFIFFSLNFQSWYRCITSRALAPHKRVKTTYCLHCGVWLGKCCVFSRASVFAPADPCVRASIVYFLPFSWKSFRPIFSACWYFVVIMLLGICIRFFALVKKNVFIALRVQKYTKAPSLKQKDLQTQRQRKAFFAFFLPLVMYIRIAILHAPVKLVWIEWLLCLLNDREPNVILCGINSSYTDTETIAFCYFSILLFVFILISELYLAELLLLFLLRTV